MSKPKGQGMPFELAVGLRYTRGGRRAGRNPFISFISLVSMAGITLGVAVLIVVMSVMNGFQTEVRDRMLSLLAHVELAGDDGDRDWSRLAAVVARHPDVAASAPFNEAGGLLVRADTMNPVVVRGIVPEREARVSDLARQLKSGSLDDLRPGSGQVLLGSELAKTIGAKRGDRVVLAMAGAQGQPGSPGAPKLVPLTVAGVFEAGHYEFDSTLAFIHLDDAAARLGAGQVALRVRLRDMTAAPRVAHELRAMLPNAYVRDWTALNRTWFAAVQSQKVMLATIVMMIMAVATFNLVSTLVMTVNDKQADIAILRTLGASPWSIMKIFVLQGVLVGCAGTAAGIALGVLGAESIGALVSGIERVFSIQLLPRDVYLIDTMPSEVRWGDIAVVAGSALLLALLSTLYPSWSASRRSAAETLRHE